MKITILFADLDKTQRHVAEALAASLQRAAETDPSLHPCQIVREDVLSKLYRSAVSSTLRSGLNALQEWLPKLWGYLYQREALNQPGSWHEGLRAAIDTQACQQYLEAEQPDLIIALHPLALLPMVAHKCAHYAASETASSPPLLAAMMPQYHAHTSWLHPGINHYFTADISVARELTQMGIPEEQTTYAGLPVPQTLSSPDEPLQRAALRDAFHLPQRNPVLLLLAHELPREQLQPLLFQLSLLDPDAQHQDDAIQWLIDFGRDDELANHLREAAEQVGLQARMFGHQDDMHPFYTVADLVLCRANPALVSTVLSCDTPLLLWSPRPGPESQDTAALVAMDVAIELGPTAQLSAQLEGILSTGKHQPLVNRARQVQPPQANATIAASCFSLIAQKESLLATEAREFTNTYQRTRQQQETKDKSTSPPLGLLPSKITEAFEQIGQRDWAKDRPIQNASAWKEAYASILLGEKQLQRQLEELDEQISSWDERLDLAQRHQQEELVGQADARIAQLERKRQTLQREWQTLQDEKQTLQQQREAIKTPSQATQPAMRTTTAPKTRPEPTQEPPKQPTFDKQFRELAVEDELQKLKQRMRLNKDQLDIDRLKDEDETRE